MGCLPQLADGSVAFLTIIFWIATALCFIGSIGDLFNGHLATSAIVAAMAVTSLGIGMALKWLNKKLYALLSRAQLKHVRPDCSVARTEVDTDRKIAVLGAGTMGRSHSFTFTNPQYAVIFQKANLR
jgi:ABC-type transport system involved in cytochrome bd biosynthesis fused ATPase/permease subunit